MEIKRPTTFEEQMELMRSRGCNISNEGRCLEILKQINYYRFTAYFLPYKDKESGNYVEGTSFEQIYAIYDFDRRLRKIIFSAIEEIEIYLKTTITYYFSHKYGALGYENEANFNKKHNHTRFLAKLEQEKEWNKNSLFVSHHNTNYEGKLPLWVATEIFSFGMLSYFYSDMLIIDQKRIAYETFLTTPKNLSSWLKCCSNLRNICAHYGRFYYRTFPSIPVTPDWLNSNFEVTLWRRVFDNIIVLKCLYPRKSEWTSSVLVELGALLSHYKNFIDLRHIGFKENWYNIMSFPIP